MLLKHITKVAAIAAVCLMISPVCGQTDDNVLSGASTMLSVDGTLVGFVKTSDADAVTNAKVSLVSQGKVIDTAVSDSTGNFSFSNVNPGPYQIVGSSDGLVGAQALHVGPYLESANAAPTNVILQTSAQESVYDALGSVPVSSCSACEAAAAPVQEVPSCGCSTCNTCNSCGGGGFGGGGFGGAGLPGGGFGGSGLGGRLGGGLLARPGRLLLAGGLIGGLAAIDGDDASPDN